MNTLEFLTSLRKADIAITLNDDALEIDAPSGKVTESLKNELKLRKKEILDFLRETNKACETEGGPITPIARDKDILLSPSQERVWSLVQLMPENPSFNMHIAYTIRGPLDTLVLEKSLQEIIQRHEILRTTFSSINGYPVQVISPEVTFTLSRVDLRGVDGKTQSLKIEQLANLEAKKPFDLTRGPLIRAGLLEVNDQLHVFMITMHHIISDGWSFFMFFNELTALYEVSVSHKKKLLPNLQIQYADFSRWHRKWLESKQCQVHLEYWRKELGVNLSPLVLPLDWPRSNKRTMEGASQARILSSSIAKELRALATHYGISINTIFLTAFMVMLFKYSGQEDLIICSPVSGRNRDELKPLIGFFNNIVPIRIIFNKDMPISELLEKVRIKTLDAFEHQDVPFHHLLTESNVGRVPVTRAMFDFQNSRTHSLILPGTTIDTLDIHNGTTNFELTLTILEKEEEYKYVIEYKTVLFENRTIQRMLTYFETVLESIARAPGQKLSAIPFMLNTLEQETYLKLHKRKQKGFWTQKKTTALPNPPMNSTTNTQDEESPVDLRCQFDSQLPRSTLEIRMARIWEKLLGKAPIGRNENFFDLGGDSLLMFRLVDQTANELDVRFPLTTLLQAPTIAELAQVLEGKKGEPPFTSLVPFNSSGPNPIFFFVYGLENGSRFMDLISHLSPDQPFFGLRPLVMDESQQFNPTIIKDWATQYIKELRMQQPQGPYFLGGYCFGGIVAYEMAQQLNLLGEETKFLAFFDTTHPTKGERRSLEKGRSFSLPPSENFSSRVVRHLSVFSRLTPWKSMTYIVTRLGAYGSGKYHIFMNRIKKFLCFAYLAFHQPLPAWLRQVFILEIFTSQALRFYVPEKYSGKLTLFKVKNPRYEPHNGWKELIGGGIDVHEIPGTHDDFMKPPHAKAFAKKLETCLTRNIPNKHPIPSQKNTL